MGHCPCHTNWDCGRRVGYAGCAALCAACGATCPNSWSAPDGYVHDGKGNVFCDVSCEASYTRPPMDDPGYLPGGPYGA